MFHSYSLNTRLSLATSTSKLEFCLLRDAIYKVTSDIFRNSESDNKFIKVSRGYKELLGLNYDEILA